MIGNDNKLSIRFKRFIVKCKHSQQDVPEWCALVMRDHLRQYYPLIYNLIKQGDLP